MPGVMAEFPDLGDYDLDQYETDEEHGDEEETWEELWTHSDRFPESF